MSFNLVFDNLKKLKEDAAYIIRILEERKDVAKNEAVRSSDTPPSSPAGGGSRIRLYRIRLEDDSNLISEKLTLMGKAITELQHLLMPKGEFIRYDEFKGYLSSFGEHIDTLKEKFKKTYDEINSIVQGEPDDGSFYSYMTDFKKEIFQLERRVKEVEALTLVAPNVEDSYVQREVESALAKMEDTRTRIRQKVFLRADTGAKNLLHDIFNLSDKELDSSVGHLMYLAGFDYEIYDHLKGNLDVLVYHTTERIGILIETTKKKPEKSKVDQVAVRKTEYLKYFEEILGSNPRIYPLLVTTNEEPRLHDEARADAMQNEVSIFTRKQVEELVDLLKKGKLNRRKVIDTIRKNIPT